MWPYRMLTRDSGVNANFRYPAVAATNSAYALADYGFANQSYYDTTALPVGVDFYQGYNSPFVAADWGPASFKAARLVAAGIRVYYEDKVLDSSGKYYVYQNPYPVDKLPPLNDTAQDLTAIATTVGLSVRPGQEVTVSYHPILESDTFYRADVLDNPWSGNPDHIWKRLGGAVFIENAQPSMRFSFEVIAYFEVIGRWNSLTPTHSAPGLTQTLSSAVAHAPPLVKSSPSASTSVATNLMGAVMGGARTALKQKVRKTAMAAAEQLGHSMAGLLLGPA